MRRLLMRVFSIGLRSSLYPWAKARPLKGPRSRWTGIPRYPEHRHSLSMRYIKRNSSRITSSSLKNLGAKRRFALRGTSRDFTATIAAMFEQELWRLAIWC
jgi:hypothetical protein